MSQNQPNIIIIQSESQDGRLMGCLGHPAMAAATPNLDRMAGKGVVFENYYCNYPLCCPSRASLWSGQFPHKLRAWNNYRGLEPDAPTFISRLQEAGYQTAVLGRTDHISGRHSLDVRVGAWSRAAAIPRPVHGEKTAPQIIPEPVERVHEKDWQVVDQGREWLHNAAADHDSQPFVLYLGFHNVHPPFVTSSRYLDLIPEDKTDLPCEDHLNHPLLGLQRLQKNWNHALDRESMLLRRRIYFAMIAEMDAMAGSVLEALADSGLEDNTWVVFTSDHGEMAGEHRQYLKLTHFEASSRVPLIVRAPGGKSGKRIQTPASLVDIYPTLLDLAGTEIPDVCDGHSLLPEVTGVASDRPGRVFAEHHSTTCPTGAFMLRRDQWKYIAYPGYPPLLFNLEEDPDELRDLSTIRPEAVQALEAELRDIVDYEAVDVQAKAEDRKCFAAWREEALRQGTYEEQMAAVYSGVGHPPGPVQPWRLEDEERIRQWLAGETPPLPEMSEV